MSSFTVEAYLKAVGADKFASDMDKASDSVGKLPGSTKKAGGGISGMMGSVAKLAGAIGITKLVAAGFGAIKDSVGDAVKRVDTLNQFPRVLQNMGYATEDTEASIARLSDGIQGLPTRLDEVASTTQRMVTVFGDVDLATESTLALNNAFIASGSSQADANRGMEQYIQMLSTGKVDMQSWRTLQETMPYALQETAESFGFAGESAQNDFYDALQSGEITMDEMNAKMIELSEETGGFAEVALTASKGIGTSFQNIKTAIVTGLGNAINEVDRVMQAKGFGSIDENLDKVKEGVQASFRAMVEAIEPFVGAIALIYDKLKVLTDFIHGGFVNAFDVFGNAFTEAFPQMEEFTNKIKMTWETIKESFSAGNMEQVGEQFSYMFSLIFQKFADAMPVLLDNGLEIVTNIIEGITTKIPELYETGARLMVGFYGVLADFIPKLLVLGMKFVVSLLKGLADKMPEWIRMGVEMVVKMAQTLGDNLPKIIAKGGEMLASAAKGFRDNFPEIVAAGFEMIAKLLGAILENLPKLVAAGLELIVKLAVGIIKAIPNVLRAMADITRGITGAVKNISLVGAGRAIIRGFIDGMKAMWESGKKWVKGIGTWIKDNKGPISYDRKLLTPAGNAIISGLNKGLEDSFPQVQRTVSGMAGAIQDSFTSNPTMDINGNIASSNAQVKSAVSHEINRNQSNTQPAYINVNIGGQNFRGFVENISSEQGRITDLELQF